MECELISHTQTSKTYFLTHCEFTTRNGTEVIVSRSLTPRRIQRDQPTLLHRNIYQQANQRHKYYLARFKQSCLTTNTHLLSLLATLSLTLHMQELTRTTISDYINNVRHNNINRLHIF
jgi:hypothetical protein